MADHHAHDATPYEHGKMDITVQQKTFEGFIRFWMVVFGGAIAVLVFLALTNS